MKIIKKQFTKRLLSTLLILCMMLPLLPAQQVGAADEHKMTEVHVKINNVDKLLDSSHPYLINGEPSTTGTLNGTTCRAEFVPETGTLKLYQYNGGSISIPYAANSPRKDLNIELVGGPNKAPNIIGCNVDQHATGLNNRTGAINISAQEDTRLIIHVEGNLGSIRGMYASAKGIYDDSVIISGKAKVEIRAEMLGNNNATSATGIHADGAVRILEDASLKIDALGEETIGIRANRVIKIETTGAVNVKSYGSRNRDSQAFKLLNYNSSPYTTVISLIKAYDFSFLQRAECSTSYWIMYDNANFLREELLHTEGTQSYKTVKYRYGTPRQLQINNGSGSGRYMPGDPITIRAETAKEYFAFKEWEGADDLEFLGETSKRTATAVLKMPNRDEELTASYKETLFTQQPMGDYAATGQPIPIHWTLSFANNHAGGRLERKNGGEWESVASGGFQWSAGGSYGAPGERTYSVESQGEGVGTYRLSYTFNLPNTDPYDIHSKEFTLRWIDSGINKVTISPKTSTVQKGTSRAFTADVDRYGVDKGSVIWSVTGKNKAATKIIKDIAGNGVLSVSEDEDAKTLTITAKSEYDSSKSDSVTVNLTDQPVSKYIATVINGTGSGEYQEGEFLTFEAPPLQDKEFVKWICTDMNLADSDMENDPGPNEITMSDKNIILIAEYEDTSPSPKPKLTGTVSIIGRCGMDEFLVADVKDSNNTGKLSYTWHIGEIKSPGKTIFLEESEYFGQVLVCEVTSDTRSGSIFSIAGIVDKAFPSAISNLTTESPSQHGGSDGKIHQTYTSYECASDANFLYNLRDCGQPYTTGLTAGTYYVRKKGNDWSHPSEPAIVKISIPSAPEAEPLTGNLAISGEAKYGEVLTVTAENTNNQGTLKYTQKVLGATSESMNTTNTFYMNAGDIGKTYQFIVTSTLHSGEISATIGPIEKADGPLAPTELVPVKPTSAGGSNGIIKGATDFMEYADNPAFTDPTSCERGQIKGLTAGTYYVRVKETPTHKAGTYAEIEIPEQTEEELANAAIARARALLNDMPYLVEGRDTNLLTVLNEIDGMAETGVTLSLGGIAPVVEPGIAADGTITYGPSEVSGYVDVKMNKGVGTEVVEMVMVVVPAKAEILFYGDVNGDTVIDILDLALVAKNIAGTYTFDGQGEFLADVNGDNVIDILDLALIAKRIAGTLPEFPVEEE